MTNAIATQVTPNIAENQWRRYVRARDAGHTDYVLKKKRYEDYYIGDQWEEKLRKELEAEGRPALTINLILATINAALGEYANRQAMVSYKPKRHGSFDIAQVLNKLTLHTFDVNDFQSVEWDMVVDGFIAERGYIECLVDFSENMQGEVKLTSLDPTEIVLDPDAKEYDPKTWNEVTRTYWATLDEIEADYGQAKRAAVEGLVATNGYYAYDSFEFERGSFGDSYPSAWELDYGTPEDRNIKAVRVISRQYKRLVKARFFVDLQTGDQSPVPETWDDARIEAVTNAYGLAIVTRPAPKIRWTVTVDKVVLHDDWSPYKSFTIIPYFPYFMRGRPFGMVRNLIGSQDHLNKITSQELHVVNTTANSGWTVEEGTLTNMTTDELADRGAETGLVLEHARGSNPPQKIQPNPIPTGLELLSNKSRAYLREISGMEGVLGIASPEISGVALEGKQNQANVQLQVPYMNLARTRRLLGRKLLELFQTFYTEARMIAITREIEDPDNPVEEVTINQPTPEGMIANDITQGEYDVVVSSQPSRDNYDDVQFAEYLQMRQIGIAIPDDVIVKYSRSADRHEVAERIRKLLGQAEPTDEEIEIMQLQQQIAVATAQGELAKLEAEAEELRSRTALNIAKAEQLAGGEDSPEHIRKLTEIEGKIQSKREELALRERLAHLTAATRQRENTTKTATTLAQTQFNGQLQTQLAEINARRQTTSKKGEK